MSFHYPRRMKDLPSLDSESEDDFNTPLKPLRIFQKANNKAAERNENKENENNTGNTGANSFTGSSGYNGNMRMYPKRSSELPTLESDSDEDETRNDRLNCAILNDSFIMSPARSDQDENSAHSARTSTEAYSETPGATKDTSLSFLSRFDKMALQSNKKEMTKETTSMMGNGTTAAATTTNSSICHLQTIEEDGPIANNNENKSDTQQQNKSKLADSPAKTNTTTTRANTTTDGQFATPQIRSFSVQRRRRDLCSSTTQKSRSAIVQDFRSQKVLFQTPMAITRAPIYNDSISFSLCDTIDDMGSTPNTAEKTPQQQQEQQQKTDAVQAKSKKSLDGAFSEVQKVGEEQRTSKSPTRNDENKNKLSQDTDGGGEGGAAKPAAKETILNINDKAYKILKKLGCGGSSSVYLAQRNDNGQECALKVVDLQGDPAVVEGYLNETKLLAKLQGHLCVVSLYEYQLLRKESKLYVVMEKGDSDLQKILQTYTTSLPLYVLMNFLYQMLQAVNYIHQNGVIHSDLKPANFLMVNGRLKLIDFGIASNIAIDSTSIIKFSQAGTFNYISPEALTDTSTGSSPMRSNQPKIKISTKSDVWSLGCILYLLLYKKTPFSHLKNIYTKISAISSPTPSIEYPALPPFYPPMLVHMVKNCLQHNPKKRPSCAELLQYPFNMVIPIHNLQVPPTAKRP